jgi:hypothetical protein
MDATFEYTDDDAVNFITESESLNAVLLGVLSALFTIPPPTSVMGGEELYPGLKRRLFQSTAVGVPAAGTRLLTISPYTTVTVTGGATGKLYLEVEGELVFTEPSDAAGGLVHHRLKLSVPTVILTYQTLDEPEDEEDEANVPALSISDNCSG